MGITFYVKLYLVVTPLFFVIDMFWLGIVARGFYREKLEGLMRPNVKWEVAIAFYLVYVIGILIFAVVPALQKESLARALLLGGLFGFFTYATYDLTNLATLRDWPISLTVVDIIWGGFLCSLVSGLAYYAGKWLS